MFELERKELTSLLEGIVNDRSRDKALESVEDVGTTLLVLDKALEKCQISGRQGVLANYHTIMDRLEFLQVIVSKVPCEDTRDIESQVLRIKSKVEWNLETLIQESLEKTCNCKKG
jgi:hypothetical protein